LYDGSIGRDGGLDDERLISTGNNDGDGETGCGIGSADERLLSIDNEDGDVDDIKDIDGGSVNEQLISIGNNGDRIDGETCCNDELFNERRVSTGNNNGSVDDKKDIDGEVGCDVGSSEEQRVSIGNKYDDRDRDVVNDVDDVRIDDADDKDPVVVSVDVDEDPVAVSVHVDEDEEFCCSSYSFCFFAVDEKKDEIVLVFNGLDSIGFTYIFKDFNFPWFFSEQVKHTRQDQPLINFFNS
jgi:hypothetical protein